MHISELSDYIIDDLDDDSFTFLEGIIQKDHKVFQKLVSKLQRFSIKVKAQDLALVIKALQMQASLPAGVLPTIHAHLLDTDVNSLAMVIRMLTEKLEDELPATDTLKSTIYVIDSLKIFVDPSSEQQFVRSILLLMLNFHNKQYLKPSDNYLDSAKWIKSLLGISDKSSLTKLIDYIAIRLCIAKKEVHGVKANMQLAELFSSLEDAVEATQEMTCREQNQELIRNISAVVMIAHVCIKNPHSLADVVASQISADECLDIASAKFNQINEMLAVFLHSSDFAIYFKNIPAFLYANQYVLMTSITNLIHAVLIDDHSQNPTTSELKNCLRKYYVDSEHLSDAEFTEYLKSLTVNIDLTKVFVARVLPLLQEQAKLATIKSQEDVFVANKLIKMGFSPRSVQYAQQGVFQPFINKAKTKIDQQNIKALSENILELSNIEQQIIVKELLVALLMRYRVNPYRLENQPKPIQKRAVDSNYPVPLLHSYSKVKESKVHSYKNSNNYQLTLFAKKSNTASSLMNKYNAKLNSDYISSLQR